MGHRRSPKSTRRPLFCPRLFFLSIFGRCARFKCFKQLGRNPGNLIDRLIERLLIRLRWLVKAANLPDKLQRCGVNLVLGRSWLKIKERFDISAHYLFPFIGLFIHYVSIIAILSILIVRAKVGKGARCHQCGAVGVQVEKGESAIAQ
jgi:hypothetical protein